MTTVSDFTATLANALGLPRRLAEETAHHLREDKLLPDSDAQATAEHAVTLLLGLMGSPAPDDAPNVARLYRQLPLDRVTHGEVNDTGRLEMIDLTDPAPLMGIMRQAGETLGEFLFALIEAGPTGHPIEFGSISVGGGPGTARGVVHLAVDEPVHQYAAVLVVFSLAPLGGDRHPDDAPKARLDVYATVPGSIIGVLHEIFDTSGGGRGISLPQGAVAQQVEQP